MLLSWPRASGRPPLKLQLAITRLRRLLICCSAAFKAVAGPPGWPIPVQFSTERSVTASKAPAGCHAATDSVQPCKSTHVTVVPAGVSVRASRGTMPLAMSGMRLKDTETSDSNVLSVQDAVSATAARCVSPTCN